MRSFTALDSVTHEGDTNTWFTPKEIIEPMGVFDLDPCSQTFRPFNTARIHICEDIGECGLQGRWEGRVWLNPPYGKTIRQWLDKLAKHGNGVALVFARIETAWAQEALERVDAVNFLKGRISFIKADGSESSNAGTGSMLLAFGGNNVESIKKHCGVIFQK
jgi:hypothetical protein